MKEFENITDELIYNYVEAFTTKENELLYKINRDTHVNVLNPRMISGSYQGKLLEMISLMIKPEKILELGTYTGYSAICLAKGLQKGGKLITIEHDVELEGRIRHNIDMAGMSNVIDLKIGKALDVLKEIKENNFDLIFLDADKENYLVYYPILKGLLKPNGWLLSDNVLWSGKVFNPESKDKVTNILREFNRIVDKDEEVENIILPLRDGLSLVRKCV